MGGEAAEELSCRGSERFRAVLAFGRRSHLAEHVREGSTGEALEAPVLGLRDTGLQSFFQGPRAACLCLFHGTYTDVAHLGLVFVRPVFVPGIARVT